ncbi:hypothetical protein AD998_03385 [bacterium 336/3]|jgi:hypothetical protein|nr:hypothetical protein AD998_03385 [bacterium 336/3]
MKKFALALALFAMVGTTAVIANNYSNSENTELFKKKKKKKKEACATETKTSCGDKATEGKKSCCASKKTAQ